MKRTITFLFLIQILFVGPSFAQRGIFQDPIEEEVNEEFNFDSDQTLSNIETELDIPAVDEADENIVEETEFNEEYTEKYAEEFDDGTISINLQNTDINQAIKVLAELTETVILPHPDLQGKVTISSLRKVEPEVVVNILESALLVKGFTVIKSGSALKVVALPDTKQSNVEVRIGTSPDLIKESDIVITQVMPLLYSSATKMKDILQPMVGKHGNIVANNTTNTLVITDLSSNIHRLAQIVAEMERPLPAKMQVKTFFLNYGDAEKVAEILNELSRDDDNTQSSKIANFPFGDDPLEMFGEIQAYSEKETNSIVVATSPVNFPAVEKLIEKLDVFPPQAMIEVVILDVTLDDDLTLGVEMSDATSATDTTKGVVQNLFDNNIDKESIFHSFLGLGTEASTAGFTYRVLDSNQTNQVLMFILNTVENSKVLSTPKILASNNKESSITVGQEIPILQSSVTDLTNNVTNVDFDYEDVGINLKVTPRISNDGFINMVVHAELKDLSAQTLFNASIINKREADATVIIPDGHSVILGGLIRDNKSIIENKIPLLGDIPWLGNFFKKTTTAVLRTELLIFLTPHIIKNTDDLKALSSVPLDKLDIAKETPNYKKLKRAVKNITQYPEDSFATDEFSNEFSFDW